MSTSTSSPTNSPVKETIGNLVTAAGAQTTSLLSQFRGLDALLTQEQQQTNAELDMATQMVQKLQAGPPDQAALAAATTAYNQAKANADDCKTALTDVLYLKRNLIMGLVDDALGAGLPQKKSDQ